MDYNQKTARHYAAYRPPLHQYILGLALADYSSFARALDIGCGTGISSEALLSFARYIEGIDPSQAMIDQTKEHPAIAYRLGQSEQMPYEDQHFDLITMAGSLFYAKSQALLEEVSRVSKPGALCLIYDFEVLLWPFLKELGIPRPQDNHQAMYDHTIDWSGLQYEQWTLKLKYQDQINLELDETQVAHLVLADEEMYKAMSVYLNTEAPFQTFIKKLKQVDRDEAFKIPSYIFFTLYEKM